MPDLYEIRKIAANRIFEEYDFSPGVQIEDFEGWESVGNGETMWRNVFIEAEVAPDNPNGDTKLVIFFVCFDSVDGDKVVDAYAVMDQTNEKVWSRPITAPAPIAPSLAPKAKGNKR